MSRKSRIDTVHGLPPGSILHAAFPLKYGLRLPKSCLATLEAVQTVRRFGLIEQNTAGLVCVTAKLAFSGLFCCLRNDVLSVFHGYHLLGQKPTTNAKNFQGMKQKCRQISTKCKEIM